jgi:hypothetical protein
VAPDSATICIPDGTAPIQLLRVVDAHLKANLDKLQLPIGELTHAAFYNAWAYKEASAK